MHALKWTLPLFFLFAVSAGPAVGKGNDFYQTGRTMCAPEPDPSDIARAIATGDSADSTRNLSDALAKGISTLYLDRAFPFDNRNLADQQTWILTGIAERDCGPAGA